jgi:hypothetical protein
LDRKAEASTTACGRLCADIVLLRLDGLKFARAAARIATPMPIMAMCSSRVEPVGPRAKGERTPRIATTKAEVTRPCTAKLAREYTRYEVGRRGCDHRSLATDLWPRISGHGSLATDLWPGLKEFGSDRSRK